jgi:uncharacterized Zn finger protein
MSEPKCPSCEVIGIKYIVSSESDQQSKGGVAWFNIAHCSECGHVYGVFAKTVHKPPMPNLIPNI